MTQRQTAAVTLIEALDEQSCEEAISYMEFLQEKKRREKVQKVDMLMNEFQKIIGENKGWSSEEEMIADLADFRRNREGLA